VVAQFKSKAKKMTNENEFDNDEMISSKPLVSAAETTKHKTPKKITRVATEDVPSTHAEQFSTPVGYCGVGPTESPTVVMHDGKFLWTLPEEQATQFAGLVENSSQLLSLTKDVVDSIQGIATLLMSQQDETENEDEGDAPEKPKLDEITSLINIANFIDITINGNFNRPREDIKPLQQLSILAKNKTLDLILGKSFKNYVNFSKADDAMRAAALANNIKAGLKRP
jgi:hypothetical protein